MQPILLANTGSHYNPSGCPHPAHAGDLPPLIANGSTAWFAFYTEHFSIREILGRAVVIHEIVMILLHSQQEIQAKKSAVEPFEERIFHRLVGRSIFYNAERNRRLGGLK